MKTLTFLLALLFFTSQAICLPTQYNPRQLDINAVLALITASFPTNIAVTAASDVFADADQSLANALGFQTTRNDLNSGNCGDVLVVFARGTAEPGNVGGLVGPEFFEALSTAGKTVAVQGVENYPASVPEYLAGGSPEGSSSMAASVTKALSQCPNTAIVMSGYSQGAQLVHNAAKELGSTMSSVKAVVTFGDPYSNTAVAGIDASKVLVVCHVGDDICQFGDIITIKHLTYAEDAPQAASFVLSKL